MKKQLLSLLLALAMVLMALAGCSSKEPPAEDGKTAEPAADAEPAPDTGTADDTPAEVPQQPEDGGPGYYVYSYNVEGTGRMTYFFHLYGEQPGLGNVFYAGFAFNQVKYAGTYEVTDAPCEYSCYEERESDSLTTGTAPQTITFYDWAGNVIGSCAFDGDVLYNDMEDIAGPGSGPNFYHHDTAGADSEFADEYAGEAGVEVFNFVDPADETATLTLYHNGTYLDMVDAMVEGTWLAENTSDGMKFTLMPDMDTDTGAVLMVSEDKSSASYTPDGGEAVTLANALAAGPQAVMLLTGKAPIAGADGMEADLVGNLYDDGTCDLSASLNGMEAPLDSGSYSMGEDGFTVTFQFDNAGEIVSYIGESGAMIDYSQAETAIGDISTALTVSLVG